MFIKPEDNMWMVNKIGTSTDPIGQSTDPSGTAQTKEDGFDWIPFYEGIFICETSKIRNYSGYSADTRV